MRSMMVAGAMLLMLTGAVQAKEARTGEARRCLIEVLHSEELPLGPLFHHTVKVTWLVTAPNTAPFEATVYNVIPWQVPPPRRGQRVRVWCDPALLKTTFRLF